MKTPWEAELAQFLNDLSAVQDETLGVLIKKRELLVASDTEGLASVNRQEESLLERLQECLKRVAGSTVPRAAASRETVVDRRYRRAPGGR